MKHRLLGMQPLSHAAPLRPLTGKDEDHAKSLAGTATSRGQPGTGRSLPVGGERLGQLRARISDHGQPMVVVAAMRAGRVAEVGQRHPDFTLPRIGDRAPVSLSDFRGKRVLLIQFASW